MKRKQYNAPHISVVVMEASKNLCNPIVGSSTTYDDMMLSGRQNQWNEYWKEFLEEDLEDCKYCWK